MDQPGAVKADELGERLKPPLDSPPSPTASSSSCETPSIGEMERSCEEGAYKHYETLLQMGGRPTCSINPDPGVWDPAKVNQEDIHVLNHWGVEMIRAHDELDRWKHFRTFQQTNRARPETFSRYQELVLNYRLENGMEGTAHLHLQPEEQTKLDEWREYQYYEHRKLGRLQRIVKQAEETAESARKRLDAAESDKSRNAIREALSIYQGRIRSAEINVERFNELLSWIDRQFPLIASEGSLSHPETGGEGHHSRDPEPTGDVAPHSRATTTLDQKSQDQKKRHSEALGAVHSGKISKAVHKRPRLVLPQQHLPRSAGSLSEDDPDKGLPDGAAQPPSLMDRSLRAIEDNQLTSTTGSC